MPLFLLACLTDTKNSQESVPNNTAENPPTGDATYTLMPTDTYTIAGELQTLFSVGNTPWAVSRLAGSFGVPEVVQMLQFDGSDFQPVGELPEASQRSYQWFQSVTINGNDYVLANYTSNKGFNGQDGTQHGLAVFDSNGNLVADHDLAYAYGITGPSAFTINPDTGEVYVLANNTTDVGDRYDNVSFGQSAILEINDPLNPNSSFSIIELPNYQNASSMAYRDGQLIVGVAGNYWEEDAAAGTVLLVDPNSGTISKLGDIPSGVGLNGPLTASDGKIVFTGTNATEGSIAILNSDNSITNIKVSSDYEGYVANALLIGSQPLWTVNNFGMTSTLYGNGILGERSSTFAVSPVAVSAFVYCDGAAGTGLADDGTFTSSVTCYQVNK